MLVNLKKKMQLEKDVSKHQNHKADCANVCGLLRKAEL